ncbi:uncharacterized protein METZ01_LOCUS180912, partial [marine metagenome]
AETFVLSKWQCFTVFRCYKHGNRDCLQNV